MLNATEAHQKGLDAGIELALKMLNEALEIQAESLGAAIAHAEIMKRQMKYLRDDYSALLQEIKQEKRYA
mgnify:CR=1 FL=1